MTQCFGLHQRFFVGWLMPKAVDPGFQAWAFPPSLAVTEGITVVFFSSA